MAHYHLNNQSLMIWHKNKNWVWTFLKIMKTSDWFISNQFLPWIYSLNWRIHLQTDFFNYSLKNLWISCLFGNQTNNPDGKWFIIAPYSIQTAHNSFTFTTQTSFSFFVTLKSQQRKHWYGIEISLFVKSNTSVHLVSNMSNWSCF